MLKNPVHAAIAQAEKERFVPDSMKQKNQWVCWKLDGKRKLPFDAKTGRMASSTDSSTWSDYQTAQDAVERYGYNNVGFELLREIAIDIDHGRDEAGNLTPLARNVVENFSDTFIEVSQSGEGLHIFCYGSIPAAIKTREIEIYSEKRFIAVTGRAVCPHELKDKSEEVMQLWNWLVAKRNAGRQERTEQQPHDFVCSLSAQEIIDRASRSKGGSVFAQLYAGQWQALGIGDNTQSSADLSFANRLYFWTGGDSALMTEIFKNSGMFRNERKTRLAISKALADGGEVYGAGRK
jgi:primase-polymerase (primpol)-like protein